MSTGQPEVTRRYDRLSRHVMGGAGVVAFVSLCLEYGFDVAPTTRIVLERIDIAIMCVFILERFTGLVLAPHKLYYLKRRVLGFTFITLFLIQVALLHRLVNVPKLHSVLESLNIVSVTRAYIVLIQIGIGIQIFINILSLNARLSAKTFHPARAPLYGYLFVIVLGILFLSLPKATAQWKTEVERSPGKRTRLVVKKVPGFVNLSRLADEIRRAVEAGDIAGVSSVSVVKGKIVLELPQAEECERVLKSLYEKTSLEEGKTKLVDAIFTATSAACVTGLVVFDIGTHFSPLGQGVILVLIQLGGLGLMTVAGFLVATSGSTLRVGQRLAIGTVFGQDALGRAKRVLSYILLLTFIAEAIGAFLLYNALPSSIPAFRRLYESIFHSISAFCNAGFGLYKNSIQDFRGSWTINLIFCSLIVFGGLGFLVIVDLFGRPRKQRLSLHTKLVLLVTGLLLPIGAVVFGALEWKQSLNGLPLHEKFLASVFQSVTARTAGFSTVPIGQITDSSKILLTSLMFIGASPGSTGGGIKTTTIAVLFIAVWCIVRGKGKVETMNRSLPSGIVNRALVVVVISMGIVFLTGFLLTVFERGKGLSTIDLFFEAFSAFGTVGLSTGLTSQLSDSSKILLCATMFMGRAGPLTIALALAERKEALDYQYPEEALQIG